MLSQGVGGPQGKTELEGSSGSRRNGAKPSEIMNRIGKYTEPELCTSAAKALERILTAEASTPAIKDLAAFVLLSSQLRKILSSTNAAHILRRL